MEFIYSTVIGQSLVALIIWVGLYFPPVLLICAFFGALILFTNSSKESS